MSDSWNRLMVGWHNVLVRTPFICVLSMRPQNSTAWRVVDRTRKVCGATHPPTRSSFRIYDRSQWVVLVQSSVWRWSSNVWLSNIRRLPMIRHGDQRPHWRPNTQANCIVIFRCCFHVTQRFCGCFYHAARTISWMYDEASMMIGKPLLTDQLNLFKTWSKTRSHGRNRQIFLVESYWQSSQG